MRGSLGAMAGAALCKLVVTVRRSTAVQPVALVAVEVGCAALVAVDLAPAVDGKRRAKIANVAPNSPTTTTAAATAINVRSGVALRLRFAGMPLLFVLELASMVFTGFVALLMRCFMWLAPRASSRKRSETVSVCSEMTGCAGSAGRARAYLASRSAAGIVSWVSGIPDSEQAAGWRPASSGGSNMLAPFFCLFGIHSR